MSSPVTGTNADALHDPSVAPQEVHRTLRIGTLEDALPRRKRRFGPVSIVLHLAGLAALVLVPILSSPDLPAPATGVRAFLAEPPSGAAPPPPPPPARAAAAVRPAARPTTPSRFVAPLETPENVAPEAGLDLGVETGAAGGTEGGVEGGVVGGIVGGLPAPAPTPVAPVRVGAGIVEPKKLKHVAPEYPEVARQARVRGDVILEAVIGPNGYVRDVIVLHGVPLLDEAALKAVRQWVYTPTFLDGVPVPVIMTVTVRFSLHT